MLLSFDISSKSLSLIEVHLKVSDVAAVVTNSHYTGLRLKM